MDELDRLSAKVDRSSGAAKADAKARLEAVREKWTEVKKQLDKAESATESTWADVKAGFKEVPPRVEGLLGVDFPILWGFLAFLLNYAPTLGSTIAAVPAVFLALIQLGIWRAVLAAAGYLVINSVSRAPRAHDGLNRLAWTGGPNGECSTATREAYWSSKREIGSSFDDRCGWREACSPPTNERKCFMKKLSSMLVAVALSGCFATVGEDGRRAGGEATFTMSFPEVLPPLVVVEPGVSVARDMDEEVFYADGYYWVRQDGAWYRAHDHRRGWARVEHRHVPPAIVRSPPGHYRRYRGN